MILKDKKMFEPKYDKDVEDQAFRCTNLALARSYKEAIKVLEERGCIVNEEDTDRIRVIVNNLRKELVNSFTGIINYNL